MKAFILLMTLLLSITYASAYEEKVQKLKTIAQIVELEKGEVVSVRFKVDHTYWLSGAVPKGQARSFGIKPVLNSNTPRVSVLVVGKLADAMERFGFAPPNVNDRLAGATIEARGMIYSYPAPKNAPEKGPSYQLRISELKGFRIVTHAPVKKFSKIQP